MASKVAGVLIVCLVLAATFGTGESYEDLFNKYENCFMDCHKKCQDEGQANMFCKMRCDAECMTEKTAETFTTQP